MCHLTHSGLEHYYVENDLEFRSLWGLQAWPTMPCQIYIPEMFTVCSEVNTHGACNCVHMDFSSCFKIKGLQLRSLFHMYSVRNICLHLVFYFFCGYVLFTESSLKVLLLNHSFLVILLRKRQLKLYEYTFGSLWRSSTRSVLKVSANSLLFFLFICLL